MGGELIRADAAVSQSNHPLHRGRQLLVVSDEHESGAGIPMQGHDELDHLLAGLGIQVPGGLISQ